MLIENRLLINSIQVIKCIELYCKKNKLLIKLLFKIINIILHELYKCILENLAKYKNLFF